jgi:hypothetical protein
MNSQATQKGGEMDTKDFKEMGDDIGVEVGLYCGDTHMDLNFHDGHLHIFWDKLGKEELLILLRVARRQIESGDHFPKMPDFVHEDFRKRFQEFFEPL